MAKNALKQFATRREQIVQDFLPSICRDFKAAGINLPRGLRRRIAEELKGAAMVGAAEERSRCLMIIRNRNSLNAGVLESIIMSQSVLSVLGYPE